MTKCHRSSKLLWHSWFMKAQSACVKTIGAAGRTPNKSSSNPPVASGSQPDSTTVAPRDYFPKRGDKSQKIPILWLYPRSCWAIVEQLPAADTPGERLNLTNKDSQNSGFAKGSENAEPFLLFLLYTALAAIDNSAFPHRARLAQQPDKYNVLL